LTTELLDKYESNRNELFINEDLNKPQWGLYKVYNDKEKVIILVFRGSTCEKSNLTGKLIF
jgi:hypothetical protein